METISVSKLKAHLSAELKRVQNGIELTVLDHKRPVAKLTPVAEESLVVREAVSRYEFKKLKPLVKNDPLKLLQEERAEQ